MINKTDLKKAFGTPLAEAGFSRKGPTWYKEMPEVCQLVNLQKSDWSDEYYINLAINIPEISGSKQLPEHKCQIRLRAGGAFPDRRPAVEEVMRLDSSLEQGLHEQEVSKLSSDIASLMKEFESLVDLARIYERGDYKRMAVTVTAQKFLAAQLN